MFPVLQIAGLTIPSSGLIFLAGLWLALTVSEKYAGALASDSEHISNLTFYALIAALLGARLSYALQFPTAFINHPASLISLNPSLLDPAGAALAAILTAFIYGQRQKMALSQTLDALTPGFAILFISISVSQWASGNAFGLPVDLPWSVNLWGALRHPSQIYVTLAAILIAYVVIIRMIPQKRWAGQLFLSFLILVSFSRIYLDTFRGDAIPLFLGLRSSQLMAWGVLAISLWLYIRNLQNLPKKA